MKIFLLIISFIGTHCCFAASHSMPLDTPLSVLSYKMDQREFLDRYGCDDSSTALIRFYFHRRNIAEHNFYTGAALFLLPALAAIQVGNADNLGGVILEYELLFPVLGCGIALFLSALPLWLLYSRKRLLIWLNNYFALKGIPKGVARNKMFKGYLQFGRWNRAVQKQVKAAERERIKTERNTRKAVQKLLHLVQSVGLPILLQ